MSNREEEEEQKKPNRSGYFIFAPYSPHTGFFVAHSLHLKVFIYQKIVEAAIK